MLRWLTRLAVGALVLALLAWLWSRYNEDLEEEEFEEEIPLEFEVSEGDTRNLSPPEMEALIDPIEPDLHSTLMPDGTILVDMDAMPGEPAVGDTVVTGNGPAGEETPDAAPLAATEAAENGASTQPHDAQALRDIVVTASGGEEDDTTVPPRLGARSQGEQEGYSPTEREVELTAPPPGAGDNLEVIKGIGPKYAGQLAEMGITTFGALLNTPMDELVVVFPRVSEDELQSWLEQAREFAESNP